MDDRDHFIANRSFSYMTLTVFISIKGYSLSVCEKSKVNSMTIILEVQKVHDFND